MKTRRMLSALIAVAMLLPLAIMGVSANTEPATPTVLLQEDFGEGIDWARKDGDIPNHRLSVVNKTEGDNCLVYEAMDMYSWGRSYLEIVSKETMNQFLNAGDTYTISMDVRLDNLKDHVFVGFGGERTTVHNGNYVYLNTANQIKIESYENGTKKDDTSNAGALPAGQFNTVVIEANTANGEVKIYVNGEKVALAEAGEWVSSLTEIANVWISLGSGSYNAGNSKISIDNVKVTTGAYQATDAQVIYSEDFNASPVATTVVPALAQGSQTGEVVFADITYFYGDGMFLLQKNVDANADYVVAPNVVGCVNSYTISYNLYIPSRAGSNSGYHYIRFGSAGVTGDINTAPIVTIAYGNDSQVKIRNGYSTSKVASDVNTEHAFENVPLTVTLDVNVSEKTVRCVINNGSADLVDLLATDMDTLSLAGGAIAVGSKYKASFLIDNIQVTTTETDIDHSWDNGAVTEEPTHVADGVKTFTCADCGGTKTEAIAKLVDDHTYGAWEKHDATQHKKVCACGDAQYADHNWDNGTVTTQPTVDTEGVKTFTCADCGETKTEAVAKLPAETEPVTEPVTEPTTEAPVTEAPTDDTTTESKGGCGSVLASSAALVLLVGGAACMMSRKKED